jgi:maleylacetoacetate isomerase
VIRLYGYWRSSSTWRVRIALHHKGIPFETRPVNLLQGEHGAAEHLARNPQGQVPVLELEQGARLAQSVAIVEYLEERWPTPPLLPADPLARARVRMLVEIVNSGVQPLQNLAVLGRIEALGGDRAAWSRGWIAAGLDALEAHAADAPGPFLAGPAPTLADAFLVPQLYNARRFQLDLAPWPRLLAVEAACAALPAFAAAHPDRQPDAA